MTLRPSPTTTVNEQSRKISMLCYRLHNQNKTNPCKQRIIKNKNRKFKKRKTFHGVRPKIPFTDDNGVFRIVIFHPHSAIDFGEPHKFQKERCRFFVFLCVLQIAVIMPLLQSVSAFISSTYCHCRCS